MLLQNIKRIYFIGIGGIGMSALARYFLHLNKKVAGYDRISTPLTEKLSEDGANIHFTDSMEEVPSEFKNIKEKDATLIIYTPAVPKNHSELLFFKKNRFPVLKRSEVLGLIASGKSTIAVAGTHGKTTISTMIAHILTHSGVGCNALLGGISRNYGTNLIVNAQSNLLVTEADEYDRSFLQLHPDFAVITSVDADHLDIYGNIEELKSAFEQFALQIKETGCLLIKDGIKFEQQSNIKAKQYYYSGERVTDFYARNIKLSGGYYNFDFVFPAGEIKNIKLGQPGLYNVENAVAALSVSWLTGVLGGKLASSLENFKGIQRRFDVYKINESKIFIDDYAHHPAEIAACIRAARELFPGREITGVFQPHLYSRTRDLADEFAQSLGLLDKLILLDIYPARELPIEGVSSELIFNKVELSNKVLCSNKNLLSIISANLPEVLITMGAGDIDRFVEPIKKLFA